MPIDLWLAYVLRLAAGIVAIQSPYSPVSQPHALAYAAAATFHGLRAGVDPYELVAIARNESDFIEDQRGPDGKDCGITQTRITNSHFTCRQLRRSYWLGFAEAAREMAEYNGTCRGHADYDRCRINHYNSGSRYARTGEHGRYWLRVMCFASAARAGTTVDSRCRSVHDRGDIRHLLATAPVLISSSASVRGRRPGVTMRHLAALDRKR